MRSIWALIRSGYFPNAPELARALETSSKTIHRDIEFMRDRLRLPIAFSSKHNGYLARRCGKCCFCGDPEPVIAALGFRAPPAAGKISAGELAQGFPKSPRRKFSLRTEADEKLKTARRLHANRRRSARYHADKRDGTLIK